jgi:hypothetical protein
MHQATAERLAVVGRCSRCYCSLFSLLFRRGDCHEPWNSAAFAGWPAVFSVEKQRKQRRLVVAPILP